MSSVTTTLELIDRVWDEAIERGEMAVVDEALSDDYVLHAPGAPEPIRGRDGFKRYKRTLRAAFPDITVDIEDRIVGDGAVVDRYRMRGTHEGEFQGITPTGSEVEFTGTIVHYLEDGTVTENVAEYDLMDVMRQLGVVESPAE